MINMRVVLEAALKALDNKDAEHAKACIKEAIDEIDRGDDPTVERRGCPIDAVNLRRWLS